MRRSRSDEWAQLIKNFCRPIFATENISFSFFLLERVDRNEIHYARISFSIACFLIGH